MQQADLDFRCGFFTSLEFVNSLAGRFARVSSVFPNVPVGASPLNFLIRAWLTYMNRLAQTPTQSASAKGDNLRDAFHPVHSAETPASRILQA